ncbi:LacI family DNA-binding transcriptional regulator [Butyrivibrio sp. XB500-5]|uniref:LacI family DNA-binding transcriptional regulator n=1 Tax=Butyrivibrio sp. XB500-5 TaxID=2364880 RepID=UPI001FA9CAF6|nr:LacI family DNA-binding transcriptional regulator [Butyrivibrio sp. XB500-5]
MPSTIKDIKEYTGLSLATISKYLNGGNVLPENRAKIEKAINELHYEVNEIARGLVTKKTKTVGILVFSITSPFSGMILHHVGQALRKKRLRNAYRRFMRRRRDREKERQLSYQQEG